MPTLRPPARLLPLLRGFTATSLCLALAAPSSFAVGPSLAPHEKKLTEDERVLHALNRLTFGPRPGDVEAVRKLGLDRWFDRQLHPGTIDDSALERRLNEFPAMRLPQAELLARYPTPGQIRAAANRGASLPTDPEGHAIFATQIALYKAKQEKKATSDAGKAGVPSAPGMPPQVEAATPAANPPELAEDPPERGADKHRDRLFPAADTQTLLNLSPDARYSRLLAMSPEQLLRLRASVSRGELTAIANGLSPDQRETLTALGGSARMVGTEVLETRLERDLFSDRQLQAVMTDFWLNHFNVYLRKSGNEPFLLPALERDSIRPHALGRFEDLLVAVAESSAMLLYLDNAQSVGPRSEAAERLAGRMTNGKGKGLGLNENYARELMELHTLGVRCEVSREHRPTDASCGQGYTQADVTEVAKVFTGWTIDRAEETGTFNFVPRRHEPGSKQVLGQTIREGGQNEGLAVLHLLASSPATARFVSTKLAVRFVSDAPPPALVDRMTESYLKSNGDVSAVLATMFHSREFWSPAVYRGKVKTPLEFVTSAVRGSGANVSDALPLVQALGKLGMPLYGMQTPNGYSWTAEPWVSTGALVERMNFALLLSAGRIRGTEIAWTALLGPASPATLKRVGSADTPEVNAVDAAAEQSLERQLLGAPVSDRTRAAVLAGLDDPSMTQKAADAFGLKVGSAAEGSREATAAGLLLGSPEFQRR